MLRALLWWWTWMPVWRLKMMLGFVNLDLDLHRRDRLRGLHLMKWACCRLA